MNGPIKCWRCNVMAVNPMNHDGAAWQLHFCGPPEVNGLAGAGTLVRYGDDSND